MFIGEVVTQWLSADPRRMRLTVEFRYVDSAGKIWTAPAGLITDGASIPRLLWGVAGSPFDGPYRRAAVLHDAACGARIDSPRDVNRMFYEAMLEEGVDADAALRFYTAVRVFGPRWGNGLGLMSARGGGAAKFEEVEAALDAAGM